MSLVVKSAPARAKASPPTVRPTSVRRPRSPGLTRRSSPSCARWAATGAGRWARGKHGCVRCRSIPGLHRFPPRWSRAVVAASRRSTSSRPGLGGDRGDRARRRGDLAVGARGIDVAPGGVRPAAERQRGGSRADAQAGGAGDPLVGRPVVGRLRARSDARRAGAGRQRRAGPLALDLGGDRRVDDRRRALLPPAHQGLSARRRVLHRGRQEPRRAPGADRGGAA